MAKAAAVLVALLLLAAWGWFAWQQYGTSASAQFAASPANYPQDTTKLAAFAQFLIGMNTSYADRELAGDVRLALLIAVSVGAALVQLAFKGSGSLASIRVTSFAALVTAYAHFLSGAALLASEVAMRTSGPERGRGLFDVGDYLYLLMAGLLLVPSLVVMRQAQGLLRGEANAMKAIVKCIVILLLVALPLAVPTPGFFISQRQALVYVAFSVTTLLLIALTKENYRFD